MQITKAVNLPQLQQELGTAGIAVTALWSHGEPAAEIGTYDAGGAEIDLPASAQSVVDAHVAVDPAAQAADARRSAIATVLNNASVLQAGKEAERDDWCDLLGCERLSLLPTPIPATQAATKADIHLTGGQP